ALPSRTIRLPLACPGKMAWATPVTTTGYTTPVKTLSSTRTTIAGFSWSMCAAPLSRPSHPAERGQDHVDELDAEEGHEDSSHTVDQEERAQARRGAHRRLSDAAKRQRNERDDDERVEDDRREDGALWRGEPHDVERGERGVGRRERCRDD